MKRWKKAEEGRNEGGSDKTMKQPGGGNGSAGRVREEERRHCENATEKKTTLGYSMLKGERVNDTVKTKKSRLRAKERKIKS